MYSPLELAEDLPLVLAEPLRLLILLSAKAGSPSCSWKGSALLLALEALSKAASTSAWLCVPLKDEGSPRGSCSSQKSASRYSDAVRWLAAFALLIPADLPFWDLLVLLELEKGIVLYPALSSLLRMKS